MVLQGGQTGHRPVRVTYSQCPVEGKTDSPGRRGNLPGHWRGPGVVTRTGLEEPGQPGRLGGW